MSLRAFIFTALLLWPNLSRADKPGVEVTCSFSILEDWCHKILLEKSLCHSLVPRNSGLHDYQLSAQDVIRLKRSQLVVGFSPETEIWLHDWAKSSPQHKVIWLGVNPDGTKLPPHAWTDPILVKTMGERLCAELKKTRKDLQISPEQLLADAQDVHLRLSEMFSSLPASRRGLITQHPSLEPFATRYGLRVVGTLLTSASGEAADLSAHHFSGLLKSIKSEQIHVIVADEGHNQEAAVRLAADAGLEKPLVLNLESLSNHDGPAATWKDMMLHNATLLQRALQSR